MMNVSTVMKMNSHDWDDKYMKNNKKLMIGMQMIKMNMKFQDFEEKKD